MANILIVDDALFMRKILGDILSEEGHKIVGEAEIIYSLEDGELVGKKAQGGKNNG